jgi:hypothetical protein
MADEEGFMERLRRLEDRLRALEDIAEIQELRSRYVQYWDVGYDGARGNANDLAQLFTEDCVWDGGPAGGRWLGREGIRQHFASVTTEHRFHVDGQPLDQAGVAVHYGTNPTIDLHGDEAMGSWSGLIAASFARQGVAMWIAVQYDDEYVRTPDGWRFRSVRVTTKFATPFDGPGWVQARLPSSAPSDRWSGAGS